MIQCINCGKQQDDPGKVWPPGWGCLHGTLACCSRPCAEAYHERECRRGLAIDYDDDINGVDMAPVRQRLARAIDSNHSKTFADLVEACGEWCHEGCNVDAVRAGVCSREVEHDGTVDGAIAALKEVGRMILKDIDDGSEGC